MNCGFLVTHWVRSVDSIPRTNLKYPDFPADNSWYKISCKNYLSLFITTKKISYWWRSAGPLQDIGRCEKIKSWILFN